MSDQALRTLGLKVTQPRLHVLRVLENATNSHMSAEAIYQQLKQDQVEISLATVYRVLTQFEQAGLVIRHHFSGDYSVFELDQGDHHDHLVCVKCGRVQEFCDFMIEERQRQVAESAGFAVIDHSHTIYGVCSNCQ